MKLPENIYEVVKKYMAHHGCWHLVRLIGDAGHGQEIRDRCFPPGRCWPNGLKEQGKAGSGDDFLKFHREMVRNFKWIAATASGSRYDYTPWRTLPSWLSGIFDAMSPEYLKQTTKALEEILSNGTSDDLGRLIEGSILGTPLPSIHSAVHGAVSDFESRNFGPQVSCDMGNPSLSVFNEHFWKFHGWIDDIYARWQVAHGEFVRQWPLQPMAMRHMCAECPDGGGKTPIPNPWMENWRKSLKDRS